MRAITSLATHDCARLLIEEVRRSELAPGTSPVVVENLVAQKVATVVGAEDPAALEVARQVDAIFVVDDLESAWQRVRPESEVLIEPETVPTGGRFVVRHTNGDGRVIEYLDLRNAGG